MEKEMSTKDKETRLMQLQHLMHNATLVEYLATARSKRHRLNEQILKNQHGFAEEREQAIGEIRGLRWLEDDISSEINELQESIDNERTNGQPK